MPDYQSEKNITLYIPLITGLELENMAKDSSETLLNIYAKAIDFYMGAEIPQRYKVLAAPGAGKRIRIYLDKKAHREIATLAAESGYKLNDVVYTALEKFIREMKAHTG